MSILIPSSLTTPTNGVLGARSEQPPTLCPQRDSPSLFVIFRLLVFESHIINSPSIGKVNKNLFLCWIELFKHILVGIQVLCNVHIVHRTIFGATEEETACGGQ